MKFISINGSISKQLKIVMVSLTVFVTLIAFTVLAYNQYNSDEKDMIQNLQINAQLVSDYSVTTLMFNDANGATDVLSKLNQMDNIAIANIYDTTGVLFASYAKPIHNFNFQFIIKNFSDTLYFIDDYIIIIKPIKYKDICYGFIQIVRDTEDLKSNYIDYILFLVILLTILIVVTYFLANKFQGIISHPIIKLTNIVGDISRTNDYTIRAKSEGSNEIKSLYVEFNQMLDKIRIHQLERDIANKNLNQLNIELEERVYQRTTELQEALSKVQDENIERKKAQEILSRLNDELEISRMSMLEDAINLQELNYRLLDSENELRLINDTKDKFFSILAHDLKNPLTVIMGSIDLLTLYYQKNDYEKIGTQILKLKNGVIFFRSLLSNLLDWARTQSGNIVFKPINFNLNKLISENISSIQPMAEGKNINVQINLDLEEIYVNADENMINTVIRNLLTNAVKFTEKNGFISIHVMDKLTYILIEIQDSGIGMNSEDIAKLFRIDVNVSTIGKSKEKGTGLGLIICKEFINKHKTDDNTGNLTVESQLGAGSKFTFTLSKMI